MGAAAPPVPAAGASPAETGAGAAETGAGAAGTAQAAPEASTGETCPICGSPRAGRFCEEDGYDFVLAPPVPASSPAGPAPPAAAGPVAGPPGGPPAAWQVVVGADRAYFAAIQAMAGEDAAALVFPRYVAERRFPLHGEQLLIGRRSRSRGVHPDIDLVGPPEDPGVSHVHALLVAQPDGWAVVDLESANGTYVNDHSADPIAPNTPVPVKDGDRIYVGAWTSLTIHGA
jgi:hypothetical protein